MDQRQVAFEERLAGNRLDRGVEAAGQFADRRLDVVGAHVLGRGVDHVAERRGRRGVGDGAVDEVRRDKKLACPALILGAAVAVEAVLRHQPAMRGVRPGRALQPVGSGGKRRRGRRQRPAPGCRLAAEADGEAPAAAILGQEHGAVGPAGKAGRSHRRPRRLAERLAERGHLRLGHQPHALRRLPAVGRQQRRKVGHAASRRAASGA